ncbi:portal protein [Mycobacterium phage Bactobuster]|uniref:Portal protein n=2 Tax=Pukovnikvirus TaxID=2948873 RepID=A0A127KPZ3_9CAUD|nr:portal protein [Mycobacterium phage Bactobuster]YP_010064290.1 portal protein [Mycobacterium phage Phaded]AMO43982.1 portal protein [Mycobacterium phage Bactobuster]APC43164.1 portal protein [Mycobacterium phage Jaan]QGZ16817.1 portal protein [Mycobacterium phage Phaded]
MTAPLPGEEEIPDPGEARDEMISAFEDSILNLKTNTSYYEAERRPEAIGVTVPKQMQSLLAHVGYPRLYVDSIAERQAVEGFRVGDADEADEEMWQWWQANNLDIEAPLGYTDAYVHGRSYITLSMPDPAIDLGWDPKTPIIRVEPPTRMHATIDPRIGRVSRAIRVAYDEEGNEVQAATLYTLNETFGWYRYDGEWVEWFNNPHNLGVVPVVPLSNRTRLSDLYGTSEITPELRSMTDAAARILMLMQATAELMGVPQRLIFGIKPEEIGVDPDTGQTLFDAYLARILAFEDAEGKIQQFSAAELANFTNALDQIAKQVAAYTGLPPQYLSTAADNPASAEAIRAAESRLIKKVERKNLIFGGAWEEAMRLAWRMAKGGDIKPDMLRMETIWRDPSTPTYAAKADAAVKLYGAGTGVIPRERARIDMGYSIQERTQMRRWDEEEAAMGLGLIGTMVDADPTVDGSPSPQAPPKPAPAEGGEAA